MANPPAGKLMANIPMNSTSTDFVHSPPTGGATEISVQISPSRQRLRRGG